MFDNLKKRRAFKVEGLEGVHIRLLDQGQKVRQLAFHQVANDHRSVFRQRIEAATATGDAAAANEARKMLETFEQDGLLNYFTLGLIVCDSNGTAECTQHKSESDQEFALRVRAAMVEVDDYTMRMIGEAYTKLKTNGEKIDAEAIAKN